jgi:LPXTG-site transpeptidase (sortase) family protein
VTGHDGRSRYVAAAAVLAMLIGLGLVVVAFALRSPSPAQHLSPRTDVNTADKSKPPRPAESTPAPSPRARGVHDLVEGPVLPAASPVRVDIPRLHVSSPLEALGVLGNGEMEVPRDPARAGWYTNGPTPGALGPAVIAGHVTWNREPAIFVDLATLRPGDRVRVDRADDRVAVFEVTRVEQFAKSQFPTRQVYGGIDHAGLRLITCAGDYDESEHRYSDNIVVFARLVQA